MKSGFWTADFIFEDGAVRVKKTGHRIRLDLKLWQDVFVWFAFYARIELWRLQRMLTGHTGARIAFVSDRPRIGYGGGMHLCLGLHLARVETEVALERIFARWADPSLAVPASDVRWLARPGMCGPLSLPVGSTALKLAKRAA